jgi:cellulose synthase/poly-beta-1,6-N-acetylglucosamine synthase-like glycosyltransferase
MTLWYIYRVDLPKISVCIATYNGAKYVGEQIASIQAQIGERDEIIVVDDASADNTVAVVEAIGDPRIKLTVHKENAGYVATFGHSLSLATGDYVFLADQDDHWAPGRVAAMAAALEDGADVVATNLSTLGGPDFIRGPYGQKDWRLTAKSSGHRRRNLFGIVIGYMCYWGCAMAMRREVLDVALPMPEWLTESHDLWLAASGNLTGRMTHLETRSVLWRNHSSNTNPKKPRGILTLLWKRWMMVKAIWSLSRRLKNRRGQA